MMIAGWIVLGVTSFALVLAAQMRMLISVLLRRALAETFGGDFRDPAYRAAVAASGKTDTPGEHLAWLMETYPAQLAQLRLARRVTYTAPMAILLSLAYLRFVANAF
ncbi:hypothetical protein [uncultured Hyphomonas sp.]|uniref:hypothetical protein n=1 Tax=uncultured Hyphomonas sp. TaxID=225298 RepID=UPI002AABAAE5|nr:hypothetical protein [uncultured Hyphomonas sp.]